jgi:hypothetical protein
MLIYILYLNLKLELKLSLGYMFRLFTSHRQAEERTDFFYKRVLHMKRLSSLRDPIRLYIMFLAFV